LLPKKGAQEKFGREVAAAAATAFCRPVATIT